MAPAEGIVYCRGCGKEIHHTAPTCPHCGALQGVQPPAAQPGVSGMSFGVAIKTCLQKYASFEGRATRPEYWYFYLFNIVLSLGAALLKLPESATGLISLALLLPSIAAAARRLHDMGRSGWCQLWALTIIGIIPVVYWLTRPGTPGPNRYGPAPAPTEPL